MTSGFGAQSLSSLPGGAAEVRATTAYPINRWRLPHCGLLPARFIHSSTGSHIHTVLTSSALKLFLLMELPPGRKSALLSIK